MAQTVVIVDTKSRDAQATQHTRQASGNSTYTGSYADYYTDSYAGCRNGQVSESDRKKSPFGILAAIAVIAAVMCIIFGALLASAKDAVWREKLDASACISSDAWMDDRLGWITDTGQVTDAMRYFYQKTGVQPYLLICDSLAGKGGEITDEEAEKELQALYDSIYGDEGHMIYAFMEYEDSQYITWIYTGRAADAVVDSDARGIFLDNADRYYTDTSLTDEEYFSKTFTKSADAIMKDGSAKQRALTACMGLSALMAAASLAGIIWLAWKEAKHKEREQLKEFLGAPVSPSPDAKDLEEKYKA